MQPLWAPWRMAYIDDNAKEPGCIFCTKYRQGDLKTALVLTHSRHAVVMMNKYPYNNGHLLIAPKQHENSLARLAPDEYNELSEVLRRAIEIVKTVLNPGGVNVGMNLGKCAGAGIEDHLHWHIVPRWEGDTNFMPVISETRVMPQHLADSYDRLQPHFHNLMV
ncbi:MAG TPA: HIT domain-containing protein [Candidatus Limnocylindria bacterium]|nr:HIT domain-containing protein [Candidatus Limnocylindria bacterium]